MGCTGRDSAGEPLVTVNCAAISSGLPESLLFGHRKGAFTGATHDHPGFFAQADGGTLFLDEIGETPARYSGQTAARAGEQDVSAGRCRAEVKGDVRVLAATNRDLAIEVAAGRFREDLYYRLKTIRLRVPALREHLDDVPQLAEHFLARFNAEYHRHVTLSADALLRLQGFSWPGNVRQLRSVLEAAVAMAGDHAILSAADLHLEGDVPAEIEKREALDPAEGVPANLNLAELENWAIQAALARTGGNNTQAAKMLGINRDTLINKLKKMDRPN